MRTVAAIALSLSLTLFTGCNRSPVGDTPEETIAKAKEAVLKGDAKQLGSMLYTENEQQARIMKRFGRFLGNVQDLGKAVEEKFPDEVATLKQEAQEAAANGRATSIMSIMGQGMRQGNNRRRNQRPDPARAQQQQKDLENALKRLFADPYGWANEMEQRISTVPVTDDTAAVLWDGKPVMQPLGLVMRRKEGRWYFVPPTAMPPLSAIMPKTEEETKIWLSLITVFDNAVKDLTADVRAGRVQNMDEFARRAGEKSFVPMAITFLAYERLQDAQKKEAAAKTAPPATAQPPAASNPG